MTVLYSYFRSSASYRVRIALELKKLPYDYVPMHLVRGGGEQHSAAFAAMNPAELVPVLIDGNVTLTQSLAIIEYLDEMHPLPALLPADAQGRARVRSLAQTIACDIHPLNNLRVLQQLEAMFGASSDARNAWYTHWVANGLTVLEGALTQAPADFCHGDTPTLADCCLVPQVYNAVRYGLSLKKFPQIRRVNDACLALEAFQRASPESQPDAP